MECGAGLFGRGGLRIQAQGRALGSQGAIEPFQSMSSGVGSVGRVVDVHDQRADRTAALEPVVRRTVDLHQVPPRTPAAAGSRGRIASSGSTIPSRFQRARCQRPIASLTLDSSIYLIRSHTANRAARGRHVPRPCRDAATWRFFRQPVEPGGILRADGGAAVIRGPLLFSVGFGSGSAR